MSNTSKRQKHYLSNTQSKKQKTQATLQKISDRRALVRNTPKKKHGAVVFHAKINTTQQNSTMTILAQKE